jgi:hypothetical protein
MLNAFGISGGGGTSGYQSAGAMGLTIIDAQTSSNTNFVLVGPYSVSPMGRWRASSQWPKTGGHFSRNWSRLGDRKVPMSVKAPFSPPVQSAPNSSPTSMQQTNALLRM